MRLSIRGASARLLARAAIFTGIVALSGCSAAIYKVTGDTMTNIGEDVMVPYLLTTDESKIACASGEALTPLLLSFSTVTTPPDQLETLMGLVGGTCASQRAFEHEMAYIRFASEQRISQATNARIESKRWHAIAAARYFRSYQALGRALGEPGGECPMFDNDFEQLIWLLGSISGLQAALADIQSDMAVGVPFNVAPKAERAVACLDDEKHNVKWWGLPKAIRASLWTIVPGVTPAGLDPWQELENARAIGMQEGVRIASALDGLVSYNDSNNDRVRAIIKQHAHSISSTAPNREYRMVDVMGSDLLLELSDRLWTQATGSRTPIGAYGTFWDEKEAEPELDQNLLDELL
ncbi:MAG: hypothetical protein WBA20_08220 [Ketobacter sp.]